MISVASRVHRILRRLRNFVPPDDPRARHVSDQLQLVEKETVLGLYENEPDRLSDAIVVTDRGLYLLDVEAVRQVRYECIVGVELPPSDAKHAVDHVRVIQRNGEVLDLPVRGGSDRFRDAWEFVRFLQRVASDRGNVPRAKEA